MEGLELQPQGPQADEADDSAIARTQEYMSWSQSVWFKTHLLCLSVLIYKMGVQASKHTIRVRDPHRYCRWRREEVWTTVAGSESFKKLAGVELVLSRGGPGKPQRGLPSQKGMEGPLRSSRAPCSPTRSVCSAPNLMATGTFGLSRVDSYYQLQPEGEMSPG